MAVLDDEYEESIDYKISLCHPDQTREKFLVTLRPKTLYIPLCTKKVRHTLVFVIDRSNAASVPRIPFNEDMRCLAKSS